MNKNMVGDTFVVVVDEIGEVTFQHDILPARVLNISKNETAERVLAAILELIDVCHCVLGVSATGFHLQKAQEQLLRDYPKHLDRLIEQDEFTQSARPG
jgi:hypothetical protein